MRFSSWYVPTLREVPAEAELASHKLMIRSGMIRKVASGIYSYLPLGVVALKNVENIIRQEMFRAGAQEVLLPAILPSTLWQESGRWDEYGKELLRLKDRHDREFCVGPTHEEAITHLVKNEVGSYKHLPLIFFQIQTKFRDETRPRFGVMRSREFIMKDAYSFDQDLTAATDSYQRMYAAYERIFTRCGFDFRVVQADTGIIGGSSSHEFMVIADSGEDELVICSSCSYAANMEKAEKRKTTTSSNTANVEQLPLEEVETIDKKSALQVAEFLGVPIEKLVKSMVYETEKGAVVALIRGDLLINEARLMAYLGVEELKLADANYITRVVGSYPGYVGPVALKSGIRLIADYTVVEMTNFVVGAGKVNAHFVNCNIKRDFEAEHVSIAAITEGDPCPACSSPVNIRRGIEVGHVFMLGTKYSEKMKARFLDENGKEKPFVMGCYGIGVGRIVAAAIEQHCNAEETGIFWPEELAPFKVAIIALNHNNERVMITAELIYDSILNAGISVSLDDRNERAGVKFADSELIGAPYQVVLGAKNLDNGMVEFVDRKNATKQLITVEEIIEYVKNKFNKRRGG